MPRPARSSSRSRKDRPKRRYQRTATKITTGANPKSRTGRQIEVRHWRSRRFTRSTVADGVRSGNATLPSGLPPQLLQLNHRFRSPGVSTTQARADSDDDRRRDPPLLAAPDECVAPMTNRSPLRVLLSVVARRGSERAGRNVSIFAVESSSILDGVRRGGRRALARWLRELGNQSLSDRGVRSFGSCSRGTARSSGFGAEIL
jgi:hypothetical protein